MHRTDTRFPKARVLSARQEVLALIAVSHRLKRAHENAHARIFRQRGYKQNMLL